MVQSLLAFAALAAWLTAVVSAIRAWRAGFGGTWMIWNGMRFLIGRDAPPAAMPHLRRMRWALGAFFACILGLAAVAAITMNHNGSGISLQPEAR